MAPEQLTGGAASVKTDIYALGLILFEMFTGKRVFEAKTFNDLLRLHESRTISSPSSMVRDLDPAVERVILRCLEHDPEQRPGSALAVAAALPGGDPLAAALAAGETPSPEMVAAAGERHAFSLAIGLSLLAAIVAGTLAAAVLADRTLLLSRVPFDKSADALEDRARDVVARLGYPDRPADTARGFLVLQDYIFYVLRTDRSPRRWDAMANPYFPSLRFWYRTSPRLFETLGAEWRPLFGDPPMTVSGMTSVVLDVQGHLTQFTTVTPQVDEGPRAAAPLEWNRFFEAAGLDMSTFTPAASVWVPNSYADERRAWEGPMPERPDVMLRVEAAGYRGRPAFFQIVGPWTRRPREAQPGQQGRSLLRFGLFLVLAAISIGTCVLARYNVRTGRGDRRGATRIASVILGITFVSWVLGARHFLEPLTEFGHLFESLLAPQLLLAAILWLAYVALEPYVRRYSPDMLMSWNRLLGGRFRDPRVGRDVLVGMLAGTLVALIGFGVALTPEIFGNAPAAPRAVNAGLEFLLSTRRGLSLLLRMPVDAIIDSMFITLGFVLARIVVRRTWPAAIITGIVLAFFVVTQAGTEQVAINAAYAVLIATIYMIVLVYFGMFAQMMTFLTFAILYQGGITVDASKLYAPTAIWLMLLLAGMAGFGFYASRAGEPLFGKLEA
jgi:Protein kinase domain